MSVVGALASLHPAVIHYPIAFLSYGLALEAFSAFTGRRTTPFAEWTLALGVVACIPAIVTGWVAGSALPPTEDAGGLVQIHLMAAYGAFFTALLYAGLRLARMFGEWKTPRAVSVVVALLLLVFLVGAGSTGGKVTRGAAVSAAGEGR